MTTPQLPLPSPDRPKHERTTNPMATTRHLSPGSPRRAAAGHALLLLSGALPATLLVTFTLAAHAMAGTYTWTICRGGNAVGNGSNVSNFTVYGDQYATPCHTNNNNHETSVKQDQLTVGTNLTAPDGALFTSMRINSVGNNYSYNNAWGYLYNTAQAYYRCSYYDQDFGAGTICDARGAGGFNTQIGRNFELSTGSTFLTYGIYCRAQGGCGVGTLDQLTNEMSVTVQDTQGPTLSVGDQAWTGSSLRGSPNLNYSVDDSAVGGKGLIVTLDGTTVADTRGADSAGCNYDNARPCPNDDGRNAAITLASTPDGQRSMQIIAYDQLDNPSTPKTRTVLVDNQPPALTGATTVTGKAEQGEQLTCNPPQIDGQTPTIAYSWFRSNPDGTGRAQINGQDGTIYLQTGSDIGQKISCVVKATDGGGTSQRESSITAGPFANGATVVPGKGPQPTGTATLGSSGNKSQPHPGDVLEIKAPPFAGNALTFAYSWFRCDASGQSCIAVANVISSTYTLSDADKDHRIIGQIVATDQTGSTTSKTDATGVVTNAPQSATGVTIDQAAGTPNATGTSGGGSAISVGDPNGVNACRDAKLTTRFVTGYRTTVRFGSPAALHGQLTCNSTRLPIRGASIVLSARTYGRTAYLPVGTIVTDKNGQFTRVLTKGAGRQLQLAYTAIGGDSTPAASAGASMSVRGRVALTHVSKTVRHGGRITFRGRLYGGSIPSGFQLLLQAQDGRRWHLIVPISVRRNGSFSYRYHCACLQSGARFRFRVLIPKNTRLPYVPVHSRSRMVRVR